MLVTWSLRGHRLRRGSSVLEPCGRELRDAGRAAESELGGSSERVAVAGLSRGRQRGSQRDQPVAGFQRDVKKRTTHAGLVSKGH